MILSKLNAHDKIIKAMVKAQSDYAFFSYILMNFKISASQDEGMPTIAVCRDGNLYYNDKFVESLSKDELIGGLVHETLHIAKGDFFRMGRRDTHIWNIASDMVINFILKQEGFEIPSCGYIPNLAGEYNIGNHTYCVVGKITEQVYEELMKNIDEMPHPTIGHGGFDVHMPDRNDEESTSATESKWNKIIIEASVNAKARGTLPGYMNDVLDKMLNPVIDWRTRIQRFITHEIPTDYTNRIPSRKYYGTKIWAPKVLRENLEIFIGVDVSGSTIDDRIYFISEVMGIICSYE